MFGSQTITDDRGREVRCGNVPIPDSQAAELAVLWGSTTRAGRSASWLGLVGLIGLVGIGCCAADQPAIAVAAVALGLVALFLWAAKGVPEAAGTPSRTGLARWLLADVCPACGYDLAGLRTGEDGVVECPECAAGWALAKWKRDHPVFVRDPLAGVDFPKGCVSCWMTDARGRAVEAYPRVLSERANRKARLRMWLGFLVTITLTVGLGTLLHLQGSPVEATFLVLVLQTSGLGLASAEVRRGELIAERRRMAQAELAASPGTCLRCEADLPDTGAISDATRVCGRCGAAWRP